MEIIIDPHSGFCFGVRRAIDQAEEEVSKWGKIYCLGEIVHNEAEVSRLKNKGVEFISREKFFTLSNCRVLIRAHGEPPETYSYARKNNIDLVDATCPVVLKLQERVRNALTLNPEASVVIYGRKSHPEVVGLHGQVKGAIIIESVKEIDRIDVEKPVFLFSQTTKDRAAYKNIEQELRKHFVAHGKPEENLIVYNSICAQVANRAPWLREFSRNVDDLVFVGGKNSSNSRVLFEICTAENPRSYFVSSIDEARELKFPADSRVGICGGTSTPVWLIEEVVDIIEENHRSK